MEKVAIVGHGIDDTLHRLIEEKFKKEYTMFSNTLTNVEPDPLSTMEITRDYEFISEVPSRTKRRETERKLNKNIKPKYKGKSNPFKKSKE